MKQFRAVITLDLEDDTAESNETVEFTLAEAARILRGFVRSSVQCQHLGDMG